jgi:hypothetical protein
LAHRALRRRLQSLCRKLVVFLQAPSCYWDFPGKELHQVNMPHGVVWSLTSSVINT